jgi:hypothetical protein
VGSSQQAVRRFECRSWHDTGEYVGKKMSEMDETFEMVPMDGWKEFRSADLLSEIIWSGLSEADGKWKYINLTSGSSVWESQTDGSFISMFYLDRGNGPLIELIVSVGVASTYIAPIAKSFGLLAKLGASRS